MLPRESMIDVFIGMDINTLKNICVNKQAYDLCNDSEFWKLKFHSDDLLLLDRHRSHYRVNHWIEEYEKMKTASLDAKFLLYLVPKTAPLKRKMYGILRINLASYDLTSSIPFITRQVIEDIDDPLSRPLELIIISRDVRAGEIIRSKITLGCIVTSQGYDDVTVYFDADQFTIEKILTHALFELSKRSLTVLDEDGLSIFNDRSDDLTPDRDGDDNMFVSEQYRDEVYYSKMYQLYG
ncbi:Hypothetical protein POVR1_LOCUS183 [uncultured virus]|nr:Hypothetical protein POVR1_LOCUS183 [uncultured virus]